MSEQKLFDAAHCDSIFKFEDLTGHVLVLDPNVLKEEFRASEHQLFLAEHGFGCNPRAIGRAVIGTFLLDGEQTRFARDDFIGVLKEEHLPGWAQENMQPLLHDTGGMGGMS
ncbi:MAG: hypothetical protein FWE40_09305 [Oscillospiraceae bacterium]|nr:hypothetical protein [Oscillospiraceae bacterium]